MSRFNQIIQSCRQRSATAPSTSLTPATGAPVATAPSTNNELPVQLSDPLAPPETAKLESSGNFVDQLKPKIKEIIEELKKEEEKLYSDAKGFNLSEFYHKLPVIPRLAHNLPDPLRERVKAYLSKWCAKPEHEKEQAKVQAFWGSTISDIAEPSTKNAESQAATNNEDEESSTPPGILAAAAEAIEAS